MLLYFRIALIAFIRVAPVDGRNHQSELTQYILEQALSLHSTVKEVYPELSSCPTIISVSTTYHTSMQPVVSVHCEAYLLALILRLQLEDVS